MREIEEHDEEQSGRYSIQTKEIIVEVDQKLWCIIDRVLVSWLKNFLILHGPLFTILLPKSADIQNMLPDQHEEPRISSRPTFFHCNQ